MPSFLKRVENSTPLRVVIGAFVLVVAGVAVGIAHHEKTKHAQEQEQTASNLKSVKEQNDQILARLGTPNSPNKTPPTRVSIPLPASSNEDQRRQDILNTLKSEYVITHASELRPQTVNNPSWNPPTEWTTRRLHELHEKWALGIPMSISSLSDSGLRDKTLEFVGRLRAMRKTYALKQQQNNDKWWKASVEAHSNKDFSQDQDRHDKEVDEMVRLQTEMITAYDNNYRVDAKTMRDELTRRLPVQPASDDASDGAAISALDRNMLVGPDPLGAVAAYLERMAKELSP